MPKLKRKSAAQKAKTKKLVNKELYEEKVKSFSELRQVNKQLVTFVKSFISSSTLKQIEESNESEQYYRTSSNHRGKKLREKTFKHQIERKAIALLAHICYRTGGLRSSSYEQILPYQLSTFWRKNTKVKLAIISLRSAKKRADIERRNRRRRHQYHNNSVFKAHQKDACRRRYQENPDFRERESKRIRKKYQEDPIVKAREYHRNLKKYRENKIVCAREKERNRNYYRENEAIRKRQRELKQKRYRQIPAVREAALSTQKKNYKNEEDYSEIQKSRSKRKYSEDPEVKQKKLARQRETYQNNVERRKSVRIAAKLSYQKNPEIRVDRQRRNSLNYHGSAEKTSCVKHRRQEDKEKQTSSSEKLLKAYFDKISKGPTCVCVCCGCLCYPETIISVNASDMEEKYSEVSEKVLCIKYGNGQCHRFCKTCLSWIRKKKVPRFAISNGLKYPKCPPELQDLSRLEERMVAARIPFMQIRPLGYEKQWGLKGNVINVENSIEKCVQALPRRPDEMAVTQIKFKRRMSDKNHFLYDKIRPKKVMEAVRYLLKTPLYVDHKILLNENWDDSNCDEINFIVDPADEVEEIEEMEATPLEDADSIGAEETLFFTHSTQEPLEIHIAPGEGKTPIPKHKDEDSEYLSFPSIFCGQRRNINPDAKLSQGDLAKWALKYYDRRGAGNEKLLYDFKNLIVKRIRDAYQICIRQKKSGQGVKTVTAKDVRNPKFLEATLDRNDGYAVFKHVRTTPAYWKNQVKRVVAMVRQLGNCALFITLSAAETHWNELLVILTDVLHGKEITEEEAENLSYEEKAFLIRSDPVTCARHFDHKYRALMHHLITRSNGIFSPTGVTDYFHRIEYQLRGSPHSHGLYWIPDAPKYTGDETSAAECIKWIDQYITCKRDEDEKISKYLSYQNHRHSQTCIRCARSTRKCRFHFPRPPLPATMILHPLEKDTEEAEKSKATSDYTKVEVELTKMGRNFTEILPFQDFLKDLNLTFEEYITAIRSTIKRPEVFLMRETNAAFINNYNKDLLFAWRANMDIQFVLDPYACAKYCVGYMLKPEGGVSKLLRKACSEVNATNKERLQKFGSILCNGTEISAQEAAAFTLGLNNVKGSRGEVFINTNRADGRIGMLKPKEELEALPDDSEDICVKGLLDRYVKRSPKMESVCLAEFAAFYEFTKKDGKGEKPEPEEEDSHSKKTRAGASEKIWLQDNSGYVKRRRFAKIIRFRHFSKATEPSEYYRERLMLFLPWRDETKELDDLQNPEEVFKQNADIIKNNSREYFFDDSFDEEKLRELAEEEEKEYDDDEVVSDQFTLLEDERYAIAEFTDAPLNSSTSLTIKPPKMASLKDFQKIMRSLNVKQRQIVNEILYRIKSGKTPFHIYLSGGAGVGKSHVITAIVQGLLNHYFSQKDSKPTDFPVIVCAPTGKAAFNVMGMTLHTAFKLSANQGKGAGVDFVPLGGMQCNNMRVKYLGMELLIIDEISLMGYKQGNQVDDRMKQIFGSDQDFGGKSVLVVGDFRQLPPIPKQYIFRCPNPCMSALIVTNPLWKLFRYYELDEIMRQRGELDFCKALNNMAKGEMDEDDIQLLRSREITDTCFPPPEAVYLYARNDDCKAYNTAYHATLKTQSAKSFAWDKIYGPNSVSRKEKEKHLQDVKLLNRTECDGLMYQVDLQVDGLYMITTNVDVGDGIFNGSTGILRAIEFASDGKERVPMVAWMEFPSPVIGQETRLKYDKYTRPAGIPDTCVPIERFERNIAGVRRKIKPCELLREQIPLEAANALTIHKSQGSSLKNVVVNTSIRKLDREHLYVACSRATSPNGLWIQGKFDPPERPNETHPVVQELQRLKDLPVTFSQISPVTMKSYSKKIYFHNVEDFSSYKLDLESDQNINCCDVVALVEPHVPAGKDPSLLGFNRINYVPCGKQQGGDSRGSLIFLKHGRNQSEVKNVTKSTQTGHFIITVVSFDRVKLVVCYRHKNYSVKDFLNELQSILLDLLPNEIIVVGDLNIDFSLMKKRNLDAKRLAELMSRLGLFSQLPETESTTNKGTQIDVCFANIFNLCCSTYETYYSYHRGISVCFN